MNPELVLPVVTTLAWLVLCGAALASFQLRWSQMLKMGLMWAAIFGAVFLIAEWFMLVRGTAGALL